MAVRLADAGVAVNPVGTSRFAIEAALETSRQSLPEIRQRSRYIGAALDSAGGVEQAAEVRERHRLSSHVVAAMSTQILMPLRGGGCSWSTRCCCLGRLVQATNTTYDGPLSVQQRCQRPGALLSVFNSRVGAVGGFQAFIAPIPHDWHQEVALGAPLTNANVHHTHSAPRCGGRLSVTSRLRCALCVCRCVHGVRLRAAGRAAVAPAAHPALCRPAQGLLNAVTLSLEGMGSALSHEGRVGRGMCLMLVASCETCLLMPID